MPQIVVKRSSVPGKVPTTTDLSLGEIAVNTYDGKMFIKKDVSGTESIVDVTASAGGGATNLTYSANSSTVTVLSDTGTDAVVLAANTTVAGVITSGAQTIGGIKTFANNVSVNGSVSATSLISSANSTYSVVPAATSQIKRLYVTETNTANGYFDFAEKYIFAADSGNANTILLSLTDNSYIKTNWNFGVGTNNPTQKLHVVGNALITGTITSATWNGATIAIANGGTGATDAATARTNLGLGTMATQTATSYLNKTETYFAGHAPEGKNLANAFLLNDFANARLRGSTFTLTNLTLSNAQIDGLFDGKGTYLTLTPSSLTFPVVIEFTLPRTLLYGAYVGVSFGHPDWRTRGVKIESFTEGAWVTRLDTTTNTEADIAVTMNGAAIGTTAVRYTFSDPVGTTSGSFRLLHLWGYNYNSDMWSQAIMPRVGGSFYGGITAPSLSLTTALPISSGGTGATTAGSALTNLTGYQSIATAAGTTTLTATSPGVTVFTGTSAQTVQLPDVTTLQLGQTFNITNLSTSSITLQTFAGGATYGSTIIPGTTLKAVCVATTGTTFSSWAVTFEGATTRAGFGALVFNQNPSIQGASVAVSSTLTAGTNAQGQGQIGSTADIAVVTTTANNPSGVTLSASVSGRRITVVNRGTNPIVVYPPSGSSIDSLAANAGLTIPVNGTVEFNCSTTTLWYSDLNQIINAGGIVGAVSIANGTTNVNLTSEATTLATTTKTQVASFPVASFRSGKLIVQAYDSVTGEVQVSELLVAHNGTVASSTEYGVVFTGSNSIVTYDVDINASNVRLMATRTTANSTQYKVSETLMVA